MNEKLIIVLSEIKVRKYDILRFDLEKYESISGHKVEIHELIEYIHPGFSSMFSQTYEDARIKFFFNFDEWEKRISHLKKKYGDNILILNFISVITFKSLKINYFIKKNNFKTLNYTLGNFPIEYYHLSQPRKNIKNIFLLLKIIFLYPKKLKVLIEKEVCKFIAQKLKLFSYYLLVVGKKDALNFKENNYTKIIYGHSFDYNMYLKYKNVQYLRKDNYGLFLEAPSPVHNLGDNYISGMKVFMGTRDKWLKSLNNFFDFIEKELNIKILIAPHPKIKHLEKFSKWYNGREVLEDGLYQTAKNAKIIISRDSVGFSYAAIYKIPAIFFFTDELIKEDIFLEQQNNFASTLGLTPINIDTNISKDKLESILKFQKTKYEDYVSQYLTSRNDNKKNFEIINESLNQDT